MKVEQINPAELIPYGKNAKQHTPAQVEKIANSIRRFGWQQPIVVDKNRVVIIGHGRLAAAKEMNLDTVPVVYADNLSEEDVKALRLADNKLNESDWIENLLSEELAELDIAGIDMNDFGFESQEMGFPENLDAEEDQDHKIHVKFTFPNYQSFVPHENELKELAEQIGAEYGLAKS